MGILHRKLLYLCIDYGNKRLNRSSDRGLLISRSHAKGILPFVQYI